MQRESGGSLTALGTIWRESGGSLTEIGKMWRESGGSLIQIWPLQSTVSNLSATDASTDCGTQFPINSIDLSWDEDGDGSDVTHIEIRRDTGSCPTWDGVTSGTVIDTVSWGVGSYNDDGVGSGVNACYRIRIQYTDGSHSEETNCDCATTC